MLRVYTVHGRVYRGKWRGKYKVTAEQFIADSPRDACQRNLRYFLARGWCCLRDTEVESPETLEA